MTITEPDIDTTTALPQFLENTVTIPEHEPTCEDLHGDDGSGHHEYPCTVTVEWSHPAYPCGCVPRHLACQGAYEWCFDPDDDYYSCEICDECREAAVWRRGWFRV